MIVLEEEIMKLPGLLKTALILPAIQLALTPAIAAGGATYRPAVDKLRTVQDVATTRDPVFIRFWYRNCPMCEASTPMLHDSATNF